MATIPFGNIGEFDPDKEEWSQYATRLRYFFAANGIATEDTKKAMLLTVVGPATFKTLRSMVHNSLVHVCSVNWEYDGVVHLAVSVDVLMGVHCLD